MTVCRRITLKARPRGMPTVDDFALEEIELLPLGDDQVTVAVRFLSVDAFIRTTLEEGGIHATIPLGAPVVALGVGEVIDSTSVGSRSRRLGKRPHDGSDARADAGRPLSENRYGSGPALCLAWCAGSDHRPDRLLRTAGGRACGSRRYSRRLRRRRPRVGSIACQLAKIHGGRVIGIAGGPEKCRYLMDTIGTDAAIDYKNEDVAARLDELAPDGVNVFFDNVGGELLDTLLDRLATGGRISICGAISQYDDLSDVRGPRLYLRLAERNATMAGFTVDHYSDRFHEAVPKLAGWLRDGSLVMPEHIVEGIDHFPDALITLLTGGHMGKMLVVP